MRDACPERSVDDMAEYEFKSSISDELEGFMQFCKKSYADHTYRMYYGHMKSFDQHLYEHGFSGGYIPEELVDGWLASLQGYRDFTISSYINTLRGACVFVPDLGEVDMFHPHAKRLTITRPTSSPMKKRSAYAALPTTMS